MNEREGFFPERELLAYRRALQAQHSGQRNERFLPSAADERDPEASAAQNTLLMAAAFFCLFV